MNPAFRCTGEYFAQRYHVAYQGVNFIFSPYLALMAKNAAPSSSLKYIDKIKAFQQLGIIKYLTTKIFRMS